MNILPLDVFLALSVEKYYANTHSPIGKNGDFITAPEASQLFCHAIAVWLYNTISKLNKRVTLVELGAGYGTLMSEILIFLEQDYNIINQIENIFLIENSELMIEKQKQKLTCKKVQWLRSIDEITTDNAIIFLANEFFDAMPIKQFIYMNDTFHEIYVSDLKLIRNSEELSLNHMEILMQYSNCKPSDFKNENVYELSTISLSVLNTIAQKISMNSGGCLIIDYGYDIPLKRNTIQAIKSHEILKNFLQPIGNVDISSQVDFGAMTNFLGKHYSNLSLCYATQSEFLHKNHIIELSENARKHAKTSDDLRKIEYELQYILSNMKENFKVLEIIANS